MEGDHIRKTPVIAVFGSSIPATLKPALEVGREISARGCILLTGGRDAIGEAVKNKAIAGAIEATTAGRLGAWVGVDRTRDPGDPKGVALGLVLSPGFDHKRNWIEAHMCDAAIAFQGGWGTGSEVAFCLVLGRPVVLVGPDWHPTYDLDANKRDAALNTFRAHVAAVRQNSQPESPWDHRIGQALTSLADPELRLPPVRHWPSLEMADAAGIVDAVMQLVDRSNLPGTFPAEAAHGDTAKRYASWLDQQS